MCLGLPWEISNSGNKTVNVKIKGNNLSISFFDIKRINHCDTLLLKYNKPSILLKFEAFTIIHSLKDTKSSDGLADFKSRQFTHTKHPWQCTF